MYRSVCLAAQWNLYGFGGLVGYDACLTRRRSSVRLRPEIQPFFLHMSSKRERIMRATFVESTTQREAIEVSSLFYAKKKTSVFREKNVHIKASARRASYNRGSLR